MSSWKSRTLFRGEVKDLGCQTLFANGVKGFEILYKVIQVDLTKKAAWTVLKHQSIRTISRFNTILRKNTTI